MNGEATGMREWPYVRAALLVMAALVVIQLVGTVVDKKLNPAPSVLALTVKCLTDEKSLPVETGATDPIGRTAKGGVAKTRIEGNGVSIVIASDNESAQKIAGYYDAVSDLPASAIDLHGHVVYVWERASSPTQRQVAYDCYY